MGSVLFAMIFDRYLMNSAREYAADLYPAESSGMSERSSESMNVLMINGSPNSNGNTAIALNEMKKIFEEEGAETEIVTVGNKAIRGCTGCERCFDIGKCVFDDLVNETVPKFEKAGDCQVKCVN